MARTIGVVVFPEFQLLDGTGPASAFGVADRLRGRGAAYVVRLFSVTGGLVRSSAGVVVDTQPLRTATRLDTLLIAGGQGTEAAARDAAFLRGLRQRARSVRRLGSVCTGAFILAAAGLLDGRRATTHWREAPLLARLFPRVHVEPDRIFIRDGRVWTSAGVTAGIDLALALIAEDLGEEVARATAQELVVYYRRPGGQSQFSALQELGQGETTFARVLSFARARIGERLNVERLSAEAGMSPRNFARRFTREVGVTPARAIERLRLDVARERVETTQSSMDEIATAVGFGHTERMRRSFVRAFGQPPQALRRAARSR